MILHPLLLIMQNKYKNILGQGVDSLKILCLNSCYFLLWICAQNFRKGSTGTVRLSNIKLIKMLSIFVVLHSNLSNESHMPLYRSLNGSITYICILTVCQCIYFYTFLVYSVYGCALYVPVCQNLLNCATLKSKKGSLHYVLVGCYKGVRGLSLNIFKCL